MADHLVHQDAGCGAVGGIVADPLVHQGAGCGAFGCIVAKAKLKTNKNLNCIAFFWLQFFITFE